MRLSMLSRRAIALLTIVQSVSGEVCISGSPVFSSNNGQVQINGNPIHIRGVNWSGIQTNIHGLNGLWGEATTLIGGLDYLKSKGFNALRIPLSITAMLDMNTRTTACEECSAYGSSTWKLLDTLFDEAAERGIMIMPNVHFLYDFDEAIGELWYNTAAQTAANAKLISSEDRFTTAWIRFLKFFGNKPNLIGIDILNEPHDNAGSGATWGINKPSTDFGQFCQRLILLITAQVPSYNKLFFIEGINGQTPDIWHEGFRYAKFWGSDLDGALKQPVTFSGDKAYLNEKIVYCPHVYGPSIYNGHTYFQAGSGYPYNMPAIWDELVGWIEVKTNRAVVIGEWGGLLDIYASLPAVNKMYPNDQSLQDLLVTYANTHCIGDNFSWEFSPYPFSSDTGGLLSPDWKTAEPKKLALALAMQPNPTAFTTSINKFKTCFNPGDEGSAACRTTTPPNITNKMPW